MLNNTVNGGESWMHHYQPKSKHTSTQWKLPISTPIKKFKVMPSAGKVMVTTFWILRSTVSLFSEAW
jgi:hypothetical protein